ncbi:MAG: tetratricopeptide repeat protein [Phycisphaera sp.]|nr:tetratricopeptide repeat protein [Phycisphaera sp.]
MAEDPTNPTPDENADLELPPADAQRLPDGTLPWSQVWHVPVFILGLVMLGLGVYWSLPRHEAFNVQAHLDDADLYLKAGNFEKAHEMLLTVEPHLNEDANTQQLATYWTQAGDLVYLQQRAMGGDLKENNERIRAAYYRALEVGKPIGYTLDGEHLGRLAETHVALNENDKALALVDELPAQPAERRYRVVRRMIDRRLQQHGPTVEDEQNKFTAVMPLVDRFVVEVQHESNPALRREQRIWAITLRGRAMVRDRDVPRATTYLMQELSRLQPEGERDLAPLYIQLGKVLSLSGEYPDARRYLTKARGLLDPHDPLQGHALVLLGQIALAESNDTQTASDLFTQAVTGYPDTDFASEHHEVYLEGLIGLADVEAQTQLHRDAQEHFLMAARLLAENRYPPAEPLSRLVSSVNARYDTSYDVRNYQQALDYLSILGVLYPKELPPASQLRMADAHERLAEQLIEQAKNIQVSDRALLSADGGAPTGDDPQAPPPYDQSKLNQLAATHYAQAGDLYYRYAQAMTGDDREYGSKLWLAAEAYDKAQLYDKSIRCWDEYVQTRGEDPKLLEAINRLGNAYLADNKPEDAQRQYERLVENYTRTPEAYNSLVPLAQCYILDGRTEDARRTLRHVIEDHEAITPESEVYRDALVELGKLEYNQGHYSQAIEKLTEAVERYGDTPQGPMLRYRLADSLRQSVIPIEHDLLEPLPQSKQQALRNERSARLEKAMRLFDEAIRGMEGANPRSLNDLESVCLRNAYFYRADAAYDLGQFKKSIDLYETAKDRYERNPASLVAMVQIVNAYCELGMKQEARVANKNAHDQLKRIPDEAFEDKSLPMSRRHWQDWLRWNSEIDLFGSGPPGSSADANSRTN